MPSSLPLAKLTVERFGLVSLLPMLPVMVLGAKAHANPLPHITLCLGVASFIAFLLPSIAYQAQQVQSATSPKASAEMLESKHIPASIDLERYGIHMEDASSGTCSFVPKVASWMEKNRTIPQSVAGQSIQDQSLFSIASIFDGVTLSQDTVVSDETSHNTRPSPVPSENISLGGSRKVPSDVSSGIWGFFPDEPRPLRISKKSERKADQAAHLYWYARRSTITPSSCEGQARSSETGNV